jgi:hypothetical protein
MVHRINAGAELLEWSVGRVFWSSPGEVMAQNAFHDQVIGQIAAPQPVKARPNEEGPHGADLLHFE